MHDLHAYARIAHPAWCLEFSPCGSRVAAACRNFLDVFDVCTQQRIVHIELGKYWGDTPTTVHCVTWSPDGALLAIGTNGAPVELRSAVSGELVSTLTEHHAWSNAVTWSPSGGVLATGSEDTYVKLWDIRSDASLHTIRYAKPVHDLDWSPRGDKLVLCLKRNKIYTLDAAHLMKTGRQRKSAIGTSRQIIGRQISAKWSPSGTMVASFDEGCAIILWDAEEELERRVLIGHTDYLSNVRWSPSGDVLASVSRWDSTLRLWDPASGSQLKALQIRDVSQVAWSPSGDVLACNADCKSTVLWRYVR